MLRVLVLSKCSTSAGASELENKEVLRRRNFGAKGVLRRVTNLDVLPRDLPRDIDCGARDRWQRSMVASRRPELDGRGFAGRGRGAAVTRSRLYIIGRRRVLELERGFEE